MIKIYYTKYTRSKAATTVSSIISHLLFYIGPFVVLSIVAEPISALLTVPLYIAIVKARGPLERFVARKFQDDPNADRPTFHVSEQEYQRAMRIISLSTHSREMKELARALGKTPEQTKDYFEEVVRNYNLSRYGGE